MTRLIPGAAPIVDNLYQKNYQDFSLNIGFSESAHYEFSCYPNDLWISLFGISGKKITYSAGYLKVKLGPGDYIIRIRHNTGDGIYRLTCSKLER